MGKNQEDAGALILFPLVECDFRFRLHQVSNSGVLNTLVDHKGFHLW